MEGRYDKNALSQVVDAVILTTDGFAIFNDKEKLALYRHIALERGLILLTDSDGAGFVIRNYLKGALPREQIKQCYIPDVYGKERRKRTPSKEGKLGVEGMSPAVLLEILRNANATFDDTDVSPESTIVPLTKAELYELGFSGRPDSACRRKELLRHLNLPERLSTNGLLEAINVLGLSDETRRYAHEKGFA